MRTFLIGLLLAGACTKGVVLQETTPVVVTARAPEPEPPPPAPVIREQIVVRDAIQFDTNRDTIRRESFAVLDNITTIIKNHPELIKIRIEGHTDNVGNRGDNLDLSRRRAVSVRQYLIDKGVDATRLIAEGYGPDNPVSTNTTTEGRAQNRRVAFTILDRTDGGEVVKGGST